MRASLLWMVINCSCCLLLPELSVSGQDWNQWRGPNRDGLVDGPSWPETITENNLKQAWHQDLPPSYSGPIVTENLVFVTGTEDKTTEVVLALDRKSGEQVWRAEWPGAMTVPFFAASNGSWIRATPVYDGKNLYVAGMRDVLVCLEGQTGKILWQVDFVEKLGTPLPSFGFASSPLIDGNAIFVQAGASFIKLDKNTGEILWRTLEDAGGMMGSAFSSPVIATIAGQRQLLVQTRLKLAGVDLESGAVLWEQEVPNFRGMNILTPVPYRDGVFTSSYQNKAWLYGLTRDQDAMTVKEQWTNKAQAYMSTPVLIDGHVYLHLQNQRFTCINLETGERTWTSEPFGKYCSLVAQGNRILALDERGILLLIAANPAEFQLISEHQVSEEETWAHLAVYKDKLIIRELNGISCFNWSDSTPAE